MKSTKALPYVYLLTHKHNGEFYFGYREANKIPSDQDLPVYRSSSTKISNFEDFDWMILAEFWKGDDAYDHEQLLISENFKNPLCLNGHYHLNGGRFKTSGPLSDETKSKISLKNKNPSEEKRRKMSERHKRNPNTPEMQAKAAASRVGLKRSEETKAKMSASIKLALANKPKIKKARKPMSEEQKLKISNSLKGKKLSDATKKKMSDSHKARIAGRK